MNATSVPLLLLPGLMNDDRVWSKQLTTFSNGRKVVVSRTDGQDNMTLLAQTALATMPIGPFAVAGFSLGGYVALEVFRQAPERVIGIAMVDTGARPDSDQAKAMRQRMIDGVGSGAADFSSVATAFLPRVVHPSKVNDKPLTELLISMAKTIGSAGFVRQQQAAMGRADSRELLAVIFCPALIVCGRQDQIAPQELSEEMAECIPGADLVLLDECGHMAPLERPDSVSAAMQSWLTKVDIYSAAR